MDEQSTFAMRSDFLLLYETPPADEGECCLKSLLLLYKVYGLKKQTFVSVVFFLCFSARFMSIHEICYNLWMLLVSVYIYTFHCRLQDISSGYWVLVLHFTRREAVRQIDELQHIATNLGRSEASLLDQHTHMWSTWRVNYY